MPSYRENDDIFSSNIRKRAESHPGLGGEFVDSSEASPEQLLHKACTTDLLREFGHWAENTES